MSYTATVLAKHDDDWRAHEIDLDGVEDIDEVVDAVHAVDDGAQTALLFVEEEDEYLAIIRVGSDDDEPRVFVTDGHAADSYALAALLIDGVETEAGDVDDDAAGHEAEPIGDTQLLEDLGTPAAALLRLVAREGNLPSDVAAGVCENAGCLDEMEALRTT